ncbi:MAG: hypothetical protein ABEK17_01795, partial [Candidatus Aenigmatarchaeota archaeon]
MKNKAITLPTNMLILLAIGVVVLLAMLPLIQDSINQGKALRPENIVRPSLKEGFEKWKDKIKEKTGDSWKNANQQQIWDAYINTQTNFMGSQIEIWRICQFGLQEEGQDFSFKQCWNYCVDNYQDKNPNDYKLISVKCQDCFNNDKSKEYIYSKNLEDFKR